MTTVYKKCKKKNKKYNMIINKYDIKQKVNFKIKINK